MQATMNAVESFRRARLVDGVTSDDDKPAAVYRLDEICDLLLDSTNDVVREVVDYVAQRLEDRSPYVKQKVGDPSCLLQIQGRARPLLFSRTLLGPGQWSSIDDCRACSFCSSRYGLRM